MKKSSTKQVKPLSSKSMLASAAQQQSARLTAQYGKNSGKKMAKGKY